MGIRIHSNVKGFKNVKVSKEQQCFHKVSQMQAYIAIYPIIMVPKN